MYSLSLEIGGKKGTKGFENSKSSFEPLTERTWMLLMLSLSPFLVEMVCSSTSDSTSDC